MIIESNFKIEIGVEEIFVLIFILNEFFG